LLVSSTAIALATAADARSAPVALSPGAASRAVAIESRCPTFRWGGVERAAEYELVLYRLETEDEESPPVLHRRLPGTVEAYTLPPENCLQRGNLYAWAVRALAPGGNGEWSAIRLFAVASAFDVPWHTIDDGGGVTSGGDFAAVITIGQPEPHAELVGGTYRLRGGFWPRYDDSIPIFADGFESGTVDAWSSSTSS
jgi:hypothetical protein